MKIERLPAFPDNPKEKPRKPLTDNKKLRYMVLLARLYTGSSLTHFTANRHSESQNVVGMSKNKNNNT
jgi:hypothetical protein